MQGRYPNCRRVLFQQKQRSPLSSLSLSLRLNHVSHHLYGIRYNPFLFWDQIHKFWFDFIWHHYPCSIQSFPWNLMLYLKSKTSNILPGFEGVCKFTKMVLVLCWVVRWIYLNQTHRKIFSQYHTLPIILVTSMLRISIRHKSHGYFETHLKQTHEEMNILVANL